jgi:hypothetical protein
MTALTNLAAQLLKRGEGETAVLVLLTVKNQPSITDSLRQTIAELLAQKTAVLSRSIRDQFDSEAREATLEAAVAKIHFAFASPTNNTISGFSEDAFE